jgi:glycosyl-4,4'-diaponeurosporenoate acyltransferase
MYKERNWEKGGEFYQDKFKVRAWKKKLPELADFIKSIFPKKFIKEFQGEFIAKYLMESCKAEFTHWSIIFSTVIFLIFDGITAFISMLFLAIILNFPFIIIQRYNRPRIISIMKHKGTEV